MEKDKQILWQEEVGRIDAKYKDFFEKQNSRTGETCSGLNEFIITTFSFPMRIDFYNDYPLPEEIREEVIKSFKKVFED